MPTGDITTTATWWPLRTDDEVNTCVADIYRDPNTRHSVQVGWGYDTTNSDNPDHLTLVVFLAPGVVTPPAGWGDVLVKTSLGYEVLTQDQATARGMTIPDLPTP